MTHEEMNLAIARLMPGWVESAPDSDDSLIEDGKQRYAVFPNSIGTLKVGSRYIENTFSPATDANHALMALEAIVPDTLNILMERPYKVWWHVHAEEEDVPVIGEGSNPRFATAICVFILRYTEASQ